MRAAVLGSPVAHSLSPVLHTAAYAALGLSGWSYEAMECDEAGLPALLRSCGPDWAGLSLTMPLKRAVLPLLDQAGPLVAEVGGANTVIFGGAERRGYNTDVPGMVTAKFRRVTGRFHLHFLHGIERGADLRAPIALPLVVEAVNDE